MYEDRFYRTVILNDGGGIDLILEQSKDFGRCLNKAREAIADGADPGKVDILVLKQREKWSSVWCDRSEVAP